MGEIMEGIVMDLISIMELGKKIFKVVFIDIIFIKEFQFSEHTEN